jgi:MFS family permease
VSRNLVLTVRSIANTLSSAIFLLSPTLAGFLLGKAVDDAGKAAFRPAWGSVMAQLSARAPHKRARIMALMGMSEEAGTVVGPILAGLLWNTWGVAALLGTRIGIAVLAEVYTLIWFHRDMQAEPPPGESARQPSSSPSPPAVVHASATPRPPATAADP